MLGDKAPCLATAPWLQFYFLLPSLWDKPAQDDQWLEVSHLIPDKELVKAANGFIFAGRLKQTRKLGGLVEIRTQVAWLESIPALQTGL